MPGCRDRSTSDCCRARDRPSALRPRPARAGDPASAVRATSWARSCVEPQRVIVLDAPAIAGCQRSTSSGQAFRRMPWQVHVESCPGRGLAMLARDCRGRLCRLKTGLDLDPKIRSPDISRPAKNLRRRADPISTALGSELEAIHAVALFRCTLRGLLAVGWLLAASRGRAQRVQFPTMVEPGAVASPPTTTTPGGPPATGCSPASATPPPRSAPGRSLTRCRCRRTRRRRSSPYARRSPLAAPLGQPAAAAPYGPLRAEPLLARASAGSLLRHASASIPRASSTPQFQGPSFGQPLKFMQDIRLRWTWLSPMGSQAWASTTSKRTSRSRCRFSRPQSR